jgi:hypothetical protein
MHDPERYCIDKKHLVPAVGIDHIRSVPFNGEAATTCSICLENIDQGDLVVIMPQCQHVFHATSECLGGEKSVVDWLKSCNKCPNCNTVVRFEKKQPVRKRKRNE